MFLYMEKERLRLDWIIIQTDQCKVVAFAMLWLQNVHG